MENLFYVNIKYTQWRRSGVFMVNFEDISDFLVFPLSALWKSKCFIQTKFSVYVAQELQVA